MTTQQGLVIKSRDPFVVITALLSHLDTLNDHGHERAERIRDTSALVLDALSRDDEADDWDRDQWVSELLRVITGEMNALISDDELLHGRYFGQRGRDEWGWWDDRRCHERLKAS